jgi:hypothetical protein
MVRPGSPRSGKSGPSLAPREPVFPQVRSPLQANAFALSGASILSSLSQGRLLAKATSPAIKILPIAPQSSASLPGFGAQRRVADPKPNLKIAVITVAYRSTNPLIGARQLYEKLGPLPEGYSLDRIDPRGPYSLDNLKYSTPREQALNTRRAARFWR